MDEVLSKALVYLSGTWPVVEPYFAAFGGVILALTVFKPFFVWIVGKTATERDDKIVGKLYLFLDSFAVSGEQLIALFKKKNPETAETLEKFRFVNEKDSQKNEEG